MFVSYFRYPQEIRGSSGHFESQGIQSVHFHPTLQDGDPECDSSTAVSERLGRVKRFEGCLPSHSNPPIVQEVSGFSVHGQDLPVQGPAVRPQGFALGFYESSGHSCGSSSPIGSSSLLLSGRLASCSRIQGPFGVSSSNDPAVDSGSGVPSELEEVFPYPAETSILSWGSTRHPKVVGSTFRAQSVGSPGGDSGSHQGSFGYRPLVAEVSRPPCQLRGLSPQLQAADEASSASAVFHPLGQSSEQACSLESRNQGVVQGVGPPSRLLEGKPFAPPPPSLVITTDASGQGWGAVLHPHHVSGVWSKEEALDHINSLELKAVILALQNLESLVVGHSVLIRSDNMTVVSFINHQGGTHSLSLCKNFSSRGSHSGRREHCDGFSLQGKIPSCRMGSESCRVSDDLSFVFSSSGDRLVRVGSQLPAPEVLLSVPGCSGVENRRSVVSLDGPSTLRVSSLHSSPQDLGQDSPGRSRPSPGSSVLASEALVSSSPEALGGPSEDVASTEGPGGATHVFDSSPQGRKSSSFSMASFRQQGEEAGLSQRAAQFAAEAFRQSTRDTYDSRLAPFREWCSKIPCDPSSAPLGAVADFLISRFDKGLTVVTLRSYRSAIASCHRGFSDGFFGIEFQVPYSFVPVLLFEETSF